MTLFKYRGLRAAHAAYRLPSDVVLSPHTLVTIAAGHSKHVAADPAATGIQDIGALQASPLSPVARIPPEILAYVFQLYVDGREILTPVTASPQGPSCLAQVCQLWRAITESDPRLWTSIYFYFPEMRKSRQDDLDVRRVQPMFDLHLERSGTLPLSLAFIDHRTFSRSAKKLVCLLIDRLRTHSRRWRHILLHLSCGYFPLLFTFTLSDLSALKYLHLSTDVSERFVAPPLSLDSAINLESLAYSSRSLTGKVEAHWERLTEVSFDFTAMGHISFQLFTDLPRCQNITTCSLGIDQPYPLGSDPTFTLPHLQTLRVRRLSPESKATFIDSLILPQLQTLEIDTALIIDWYGSSPSWNHRHFSNLLVRSGCALRHLSIQDVDFPSDEVVRCLSVSRALTSLRFIPYPRSQNITEVIRALDVSHVAPVVGDQTLTQGNEEAAVMNGPPSPELREVTLATSQEGCLDLMMAMLRSRGSTCAHAEKVAALRRAEVVFFYMPHRQEDQLGRVEAFRGELAQWVAECEAVDGCGVREREASVVIDSPYLVEYINVE